MSNVKLEHPANPGFVIQRSEEDAENYKSGGWLETNKAVTKSDDD